MSKALLMEDIDEKLDLIETMAKAVSNSNQ